MAVIPLSDVNLCLLWRKLGNPRERGHWGDPDVDGRIILR